MTPLGLADLELTTPERISLGLPLAGVGYRCLAYLVDLGVLFTLWVTVYFVYSVLEAGVFDQIRGLSGLGWTFLALAVFATQWVYWTAWEVFGRGQTPGKRALRIRVVREDGSPTGFFESAVRNFCRAVDFLPALYAIGLVTMLVSRRHVRLGDLLAGTVLVREESINLDRYSGATAIADKVQLNATETELVLEFLARAPSLESTARARLGLSLLERVAPGLSSAALDQARRSATEAEGLLRMLVGAPAA